MFVPDIMHEFDLGVWKATLTHLIRILYAAAGTRIQEMNSRYRASPPYGDTICKISKNVSGMKQLAARDYEDILQVSCRVFTLIVNMNSLLIDIFTRI